MVSGGQQQFQHHRSCSKLLVVEDHALVREGLAQTLRLLGPDVMVLEAADCDSAESSAAGVWIGRFDVADLGLPRPMAFPTF